MLLPSVKSCLKYQFLEETDEQCRDLCVRKHGNNGPSVLHVTRNNTKSSLEGFSWDAIIEEKQDRAPNLLDFISTVSVPVVNENGNQVPPVCVAYGPGFKIAAGCRRQPTLWPLLPAIFHPRNRKR